MLQHTIKPIAQIVSRPRRPAYLHLSLHCTWAVTWRRVSSREEYMQGITQQMISPKLQLIKESKCLSIQRIRPTFSRALGCLSPPTSAETRTNSLDSACYPTHLFSHIFPEVKRLRISDAAAPGRDIGVNCPLGSSNGFACV